MSFNPLSWLVAFINNTLLPKIGTFLKELFFLYGQVKDHRSAWNDILFVSRAFWFYLLLNLMAIAFFWVLPQGTDILYAMIEDFYSRKPAGLFMLFFGTFIWSLIAEFAARYRIMVIDNSGNFLSNERVRWRKFIQKFFVKLFLLFPFLIMIIGVFLASLRWKNDIYQAFTSASLVILILISGFLLVYNLYFGKLNRIWAKLFKRNGTYFISDEFRIKSFLFGIYNDYVFRYHNGYIKGGNSSIQYGKFSIDPQWYNKPLDELPHAIKNFPFSDDVPEFIRPHNHAILRRITFPNYQEEEVVERKDVYIRWEYEMPFSIYPILNKEISLVASLGFFILIAVSAMPISWYQFIGSSALVAFAFAGWIGVITFLLFLDKANPFRGKFLFLNHIPWRLSISCWILLCSLVNNDHEVRTLSKGPDPSLAHRITLGTHFKKWVTKKQQEWRVLHAGQKRVGSDSTHTENDGCKPQVPLLLVCAEGGALRTGAMAALLMAKLEDKYPDFKDHIYAFSTVSGGTVGIGFYNAISFRCRNAKKDISADSLTKEFFKKDFLAPVIAKLFYGDLFHLFSFRHFEIFDRAVALEESWEQAFHNISLGMDAPEVFSKPFLDSPDSIAQNPVWFINTTEVESGNQAWVTNIVPNGLALSNARDVLSRVQGTIRYSTAINFSSRFPLISPAAAVGATGLDRYHFVDGGYVENTGAQTMLEMLISLREEDVSLFEQIIPYVLMIRFGPDDSNRRPPTVSFGNEWNEIITGLYNTRSGRAELATHHLLKFCKTIREAKKIDSCTGRFPYPNDKEVRFTIDLKKVPMNWLLSDNSLNEVNDYCKKIVEDTSTLNFITALSMKEKRHK